MKLIVVNGSPAAGKTTVAEKLHKDLSMSLLADVDAWRRLVSDYRENREESLKLSYKMAVAAVDAYLGTGHDVIVDKAILSDDSVIDALIESGKRHMAEVYEFILIADKETVIKRAHERGFHENGLLTPEKVPELWEKAQKLIAKRPNAIVIDTGNQTPELTYKKIKEIVLD
jgi:broad-specificity NMP kinase